MRTLEDRLMDKACPEPNSGCWLWEGADNGKDYGRIEVSGRREYAHRVSWELNCGPIPDGLFVLHHCDIPCCVNPAHLFLGTHQDNMDDGSRKGRFRNKNSRKTHCERGHSLAGDNLYTSPSGYRQCRICDRGRRKKRRIAARERDRRIGDED